MFYTSWQRVIVCKSARRSVLLSAGSLMPRPHLQKEGKGLVQVLGELGRILTPAEEFPRTNQIVE